MSTTATKFEKAKEVYTVGDGYIMFRMHTQPMKPFQIESMSGADPDILLGGEVHYLPRKFDTQKQKRKQQQKTGQFERRRLRRLFQHLVHMVHVQRVSLGEGRKGRRHDLCVIVSPYIHKHISLTFQNVSMTEGGWVFLGSNGVILDNINRKMLFHKSQGWEVEFLL